jgi:hypothetical protein
MCLALALTLLPAAALADGSGTPTTLDIGNGYIVIDGNNVTQGNATITPNSAGYIITGSYTQPDSLSERDTGKYHRNRRDANGSHYAAGPVDHQQQDLSADDRQSGKCNTRHCGQRFSARTCKWKHSARGYLCRGS